MPKDTRKRSSTAVRFPPELHTALAEAAWERDVSLNWMINRAVEDFLSRLIPADEIRWTRDEKTTNNDERTQ